MCRTQGGRVEPEAGGGPVREILHEHVGTGDELTYDVDPARILQIERDRLLPRLHHTKCEARPPAALSYPRAKSPPSIRSTLITRAPRSAS